MKRKVGKKLKNNNNIKMKWNENKFKINKLLLYIILNAFKFNLIFLM